MAPFTLFVFLRLLVPYLRCGTPRARGIWLVWEVVGEFGRNTVVYLSFSFVMASSCTAEL